MRNCTVWCCQTRGYNVEGVQYFKVTEDRISDWARALSRNPNGFSKHSFVCSLHFTQDDFYKKGRKKLLKASAIPSLQLSPSTLKTSHQVVCVKGCYRIISIPNKENISPVKEEPLQIEVDPLQIEEDPLQSVPSTSGIIRDNFSSHRSEDCNANRTELGMLGQFPSIGEESPEIGPSLDSSIAGVQNERQSDIEKKWNVQETSSDSKELKESPTRQKHLVETYHNYCQTPWKLSRSIVLFKEQKSDLRQKLRNERRKVMRLKRKVSHLKQVVRRLKQNQVLSVKSAADVLLHAITRNNNKRKRSKEQEKCVKAKKILPIGTVL